MNEHESRDEQFDETLSGEHFDVGPSIDTRASAWLDSASMDQTALGELSSLESLGSLDQPAARRLADMQFLHVLLNELHHCTAELNSARVQRAMALIHEEPSFIGDAAVVALADESSASRGAETFVDVPIANAPADQPRRWSRAVTDRRGWFLSATAVAATLAGLALWLVTAMPAQAIDAAVKRVTADARILKDRQYRVTQSLNFEHGQQGQDKSTLYVRGGQKFALEHPGLLGTVWMGSNGREGWIIPALGPPIVTDNPRYPARWAREEGLALPDLKLTGLLDLMKERFHLSLPPGEPLPEWPEIDFQRISGWCDVNDGGAKRIELWAHPDTGVAHRLVLEWDRSPGEVGLTAIQLDFLKEVEQSDVWYEVEAHRHARPILRKFPMLPSAL